MTSRRFTQRAATLVAAACFVSGSDMSVAEGGDRSRIRAAEAAPAAASTTSSSHADTKIEPRLVERLRREGRASFLVRFASTGSPRQALERAAAAPDRRRAVYDELRGRARVAQLSARKWLDERRVPFRRLWVVNALQVEGSLALAQALAARPEVERILDDPRVRGIDPEIQEGAEALAPEAVGWGVANVRAPDVWATDGVRGEGIVVASADTGVEWNHPALIRQYRGWDGVSVNHDYNWYDAVADLPGAFDDSGHGTHTTGSIVGDDGLGNQVGVAPGARWIGCRNMDHGFGQPSTYLGCIQFFLAPWPHGGDPELDGDPAKAAHIVNNSWGCPPSEGCDPDTLQEGFAALRAAGILAVASAGNSGPVCSSVDDPPGLYEASFVVGAISSSNTLGSYSSRGPVTVNGSGRMRPDLAAPGTSVLSSTVGGGYGSGTGTSMASPHVSGSAALLWSARPELRGNVNLTRCILVRTTNTVTVAPQTCGGVSSLTRPNNQYGWGRVNAYAAIHPTVNVDADHVVDACDCDPGDSSAFDAPEEVKHVTVDPDRVTVRWDAIAPRFGTGTVYDLLRGTLSDLASAGGIVAATCHAGDLTSASFADADFPDAGDGFFYLVAARNSCGFGGWGFTNDGARLHAGCP